MMFGGEHDALKHCPDEGVYNVCVCVSRIHPNNYLYSPETKGRGLT